jgi:ribosomal protein S18 acetylase RimI-like enzyme
MTKLKADELEPITITAITEENFSFFEPFIPKEILRELNAEDCIIMGAIVDETACGIIIARAEEGRAQLLWIYVAEDYRRQYIGSTLFCEIADFLEDPDEYDLEGIICRYAVSEDDNSVNKFFGSLQFEQEETGEYSVSLTMQEISELGFVKSAANNNNAGAVIYAPIAKLSPFHLHKLNSELDKNEANFTGEAVSYATVIPACSMVMYRGNNPTGCICFTDGETKNERVLSVLFIQEKESSAIKGMFGSSAVSLIKSNTPDTVIKIPVVSESAGKMAKLMLGGNEKVCEKVILSRFFFKKERVKK